jgi:diguanylate cyclase (GGDEF)-like protein/PAS domain S-box-containing protein
MPHISLLPSRLNMRQMLLVATILLPALGILILQAVSDRKQAEVRLAQEAHLFSAQVGMGSKEILPDPETYLSQLAKLPELFSNDAVCENLMQTWLKADYYFHNLFVAAPNGRLTCSGLPLDSPVNVKNRSYYKRAIESKRFSIGDFQRSRDNTPIIVFALPVLNDAGEVVAIIGASARLTWFEEAFKKALSTTSLEAVTSAAIDENGLIIAASPNRPDTGKFVKGWSESVREGAKKSIYVSRETMDNGAVLATTYLALYKSETANIYLRVGIPQDAAMALVAANTKQRLGFLFAFALITAISAWWLTSWLVITPIRRLKTTALSLGGGALNARTGVPHADGEIGELAKHFDAMAERLEAQHNARTQLTRLKALRGEVNAAVLRAKDEATLLHEVCEIVRKGGEFDIAMVAYVDRRDPSKLHRRAWSASDTHAATLLADSGWLVRPPPADPIVCAVATGSVCLNRHNDQGQKKEWLESEGALGCREAIGLPIVSAGRIIGGIGIYSRKDNDFDADQIQMLLDTASDLGFGVGALQADKRLRESQDLLRMIVDNIPTMIFAKDVKNFAFVSINKAGERLLGRTEAELLGKTDFDLFPKSQADYFRKMDEAALIAEKEFVVTDEPITTAAGDTRLVETKKLRLLAADGTSKYLLGISEDITERRLAERHLNFMAEHDQLTGLVNRYGLSRHFEVNQSQAAAGEPSQTTALYVDVDGFKEINDTLGHAVGDKLLGVVAQLLKQARDGNHEVARVGGDEFIIMLGQQNRDEDAVALAEHIRQRCEQPFQIGDHEIFISVSIGISSLNEQVKSYDELLRTADIAMYHAKSQGRNRYVVYSPDMHSRATERLAMRNHLRHAISNNELTVHYQPRVSMLTGEIIGAEALLRWTNSQLGSISPAVFIPLAEDSGLIVPIGNWVLRQACLQAKAWESVVAGHFQMAVNLSPRQLRQVGLLETIKLALSESGLPAESLELEITESTLMDRGSDPIGVLNAISALGIRLAVDDFGTGYSNLSYLKKLPVDVLKVDQSFVRGLTHEKNDLMLVTAIVAMAKSLSLSVTAEGIETREQWDIIRGLGVDDYQGYYFAKPMRPEEFLIRLKQEQQEVVRRLL